MGGPKNWGYNTATCQNACKDYKYMALQAGGWCVCDNHYHSRPKYRQVASFQCGRYCGSGRCGAGWRNAVYKVNLGVEAEVKQCKAQLEKCNKMGDTKSCDAWHSDTMNLNNPANQLHLCMIGYGTDIPMKCITQRCLFEVMGFESQCSLQGNTIDVARFCLESMNDTTCSQFDVCGKNFGPLPV